MLLNALRVSLTLQRIQFFKGGLNKLHNLIFQLSSLQKSQAYSTETSREKKKKKAHISYILHTKYKFSSTDNNVQTVIYTNCHIHLLDSVFITFMIK